MIWLLKGSPAPPQSSSVWLSPFHQMVGVLVPQRRGTRLIKQRLGSHCFPPDAPALSHPGSTHLLRGQEVSLSAGLPELQEHTGVATGPLSPFSMERTPRDPLSKQPQTHGSRKEVLEATLWCCWVGVTGYCGVAGRLGGVGPGGGGEWERWDPERDLTPPGTPLTRFL